MTTLEELLKKSESLARFARHDINITTKELARYVIALSIELRKLMAPEPVADTPDPVRADPLQKLTDAELKDAIDIHVSLGADLEDKTLRALLELEDRRAVRPDPVREELLAALKKIADHRDVLGDAASNLITVRLMALSAIARAGSPAPAQDTCRLCSHPKHTDRCEEDAPNAQFRCACAGECPHGKDALYCSNCRAAQEKPK